MTDTSIVSSQFEPYRLSSGSQLFCISHSDVKTHYNQHLNILIDQQKHYIQHTYDVDIEEIVLLPRKLYCAFEQLTREKIQATGIWRRFPLTHTSTRTPTHNTCLSGLDHKMCTLQCSMTNRENWSRKDLNFKLNIMGVDNCDESQSMTLDYGTVLRFTRGKRSKINMFHEISRTDTKRRQPTQQYPDSSVVLWESIEFSDLCERHQTKHNIFILYYDRVKRRRERNTYDTHHSLLTLREDTLLDFIKVTRGHFFEQILNQSILLEYIIPTLHTSWPMFYKRLMTCDDIDIHIHSLTLLCTNNALDRHHSEWETLYNMCNSIWVWFSFHDTPQLHCWCRVERQSDTQFRVSQCQLIVSDGFFYISSSGDDNTIESILTCWGDTTPHTLYRNPNYDSNIQSTDRVPLSVFWFDNTNTTLPYNIAIVPDALMSKLTDSDSHIACCDDSCSVDVFRENQNALESIQVVPCLFPLASGCVFKIQDHHTIERLHRFKLCTISDTDHTLTCCDALWSEVDRVVGRKSILYCGQIISISLRVKTTTPPSITSKKDIFSFEILVDKVYGLQPDKYHATFRPTLVFCASLHKDNTLPQVPRNQLAYRLVYESQSKPHQYIQDERVNTFTHDFILPSLYNDFACKIRKHIYEEDPQQHALQIKPSHYWYRIGSELRVQCVLQEFYANQHLSDESTSIKQQQQHHRETNSRCIHRWLRLAHTIQHYTHYFQKRISAIEKSFSETTQSHTPINIEHNMTRLLSPISMISNHMDIERDGVYMVMYIEIEHHHSLNGKTQHACILMDRIQWHAYFGGWVSLGTGDNDCRWLPDEVNAMCSDEQLVAYYTLSTMYILETLLLVSDRSHPKKTNTIHPSYRRIPFSDYNALCAHMNESIFSITLSANQYTVHGTCKSVFVSEMFHYMYPSRNVDTLFSTLFLEHHNNTHQQHNIGFKLCNINGYSLKQWVKKCRQPLSDDELVQLTQYIVSLWSRVSTLNFKKESNNTTCVGNATSHCDIEWWQKQLHTLLELCGINYTQSESRNVDQILKQGHDTFKCHYYRNRTLVPFQISHRRDIENKK